MRDEMPALPLLTAPAGLPPARPRLLDSQRCPHGQQHSHSGHPRVGPGLHGRGLLEISVLDLSLSSSRFQYPKNKKKILGPFEIGLK